MKRIALGVLFATAWFPTLAQSEPTEGGTPAITVTLVTGVAEARTMGVSSYAYLPQFPDTVSVTRSFGNDYAFAQLTSDFSSIRVGGEAYADTDHIFQTGYADASLSIFFTVNELVTYTRTIPLITYSAELRDGQGTLLWQEFFPTDTCDDVFPQPQVCSVLTPGTYELRLWAWALGNSCGGCFIDTISTATLDFTICPDDDQDGVCEVVDNCPDVANPTQADSDGDGIGDACDPCVGPFSDDDLDGFCEDVDNCVDIANPSQADQDADGFGDVCDNCPADGNTLQLDGDSDTVGDDCDNCPAVPNSSQADGDEDQVGLLCDNCPAVRNATQNDNDADGAGNQCDCANNDPAIGPARPVWGVTAQKLSSTIRLNWPSTTGASSYEVIRGTVFGLPVGLYGSCLDDNVVGFTYDDAAVPVPGDPFVYLIRGSNPDCGDGVIGFDSTGTVRDDAGVTPCP